MSRRALALACALTASSQPGGVPGGGAAAAGVVVQRSRVANTFAVPPDPERTLRAAHFAPPARLVDLETRRAGLRRRSRRHPRRCRGERGRARRSGSRARDAADRHPRWHQQPGRDDGDHGGARQRASRRSAMVEIPLGARFAAWALRRGIAAILLSSGARLEARAIAVYNRWAAEHGCSDPPTTSSHR